MNSVRSLTAEDVNARLNAKECVNLMRQTFIDLENGKSKQYLRAVFALSTGNVMGVMPADFNSFFGAKILSVYPSNYRRNLPSHQGEILVFDGETGSLKGLVDAMSVTGIRTGACSAVATDVLASPFASVLALIGCGHQGWSHLAAIKEIRDLTEIRVFDQISEKAQSFAKDASERYGVNVIACSSVKQAVETADIVCTLTSSKTPVLESGWIKRGCHINAVGACSKDARELPSDLVIRSRFYCDSVESVMNESGDFLFPLKEGLISEGHLLGTVGELLCGKIEGRTSADQITIFESLGMAVEDLAAADYVLGKD
ncbi:MAG: ornithine cyclodeaminase family protein [Clostridiales bacterium]|nr:ornithine cyclodeaminase family protein [Clostridiales bacterium]